MILRFSIFCMNQKILSIFQKILRFFSKISIFENFFKCFDSFCMGKNWNSYVLKSLNELEDSDDFSILVEKIITSNNFSVTIGKNYYLLVIIFSITIGNFMLSDKLWKKFFFVNIMREENSTINEKIYFSFRSLLR